MLLAMVCDAACFEGEDRSQITSFPIGGKKRGKPSFQTRAP